MSRAGRLRAENLTVRLGGRLVLASVNLELQPGQVTAVVGPNGAGKSTLLSCLSGLRRPDSGEARLDERSLASLKPRVRARMIGYLPQTAELVWRLDVRTLVRLGRTAHRGLFGAGVEDKAAVEAALSATGLCDLAERNVSSLSGGERARALIARALAGEPDWLVADEPLSGLDLGHQMDAADLLRRFAEAGGGVVMSVHDLAFAARTASRILVMAGGRVVADGPADLALRPEVLRAAYGVEARWIDGAKGPLLDILERLA